MRTSGRRPTAETESQDKGEEPDSSLGLLSPSAHSQIIQQQEMLMVAAATVGSSPTPPLPSTHLPLRSSGGAGGGGFLPPSPTTGPHSIIPCSCPNGPRTGKPSKKNAEAEAEEAVAVKFLEATRKTRRKAVRPVTAKAAKAATDDTSKKAVEKDCLGGKRCPGRGQRAAKEP
jgi:hypothetical protein